MTFDLEVTTATAPSGWSVRVDWDGAAFTHANADITSRIIGRIPTKRGRNIASSILGRSVAGTLTVDLDNSDGLFDTHNASSDLSGLALPGPIVQLRYETTPIWTGYLDSLPITYSRGGAHVAKLRAYGIFALLALAEIAEGSNSATETGDAVETIALNGGVPAEEIAGDYSMPQWWEVGRMLEGLRHIEDTEGGFLYERRTGAVSMQAADHRAGQTVAATFVLEGTVGSGEIEASGIVQELAVKDVINEVSGDVRQFEEETDRVLYAIESTFSIELGGTRTILSDFGSDGLIVSVDNPVAGTDYAANSAGDGTGTAHTSDIQVGVALAGFNRVRVEVVYPTVSGTTQPAAVHVTMLRVKGTVIAPTTPEKVVVSDNTSQDQYGLKTLLLSNTWIAGRADMRDRLDIVLEELKDPPLRLKVKWLVDADTIGDFLGLELSDRVAVRLPFYDTEGFVENIDLAVDRTGEFALCTTEVSIDAATVTAAATTSAPFFADDTGDAQDWTQNAAITPFTVPTATGSPTPTYAAVGSLPAGISFDTTTRVISGTPTAVGSGTFTIRATNSEGSDDWTVDYATTAAITGDSVTVPLTGLVTSSTNITWEDNVSIGDTFAADGTVQTLNRLRLWDTGGTAGQVHVNIVGSLNDFTGAFEASGRIIIEASDGETLEIVGTGSDVSEPYTWTPTNSAEVVAFVAHVRGLTDQDATLTLSD